MKTYFAILLIVIVSFMYYTTYDHRRLMRIEQFIEGVK